MKCIFTTYSGIKMDLFSPKESNINIYDIARSLSMKCRYNGHIEKFYSVAEHCVLVSRFCTKELALSGLLHDAAEAYFLDVPTYLKYSEPLDQYRELENNMQRLIFQKYTGFNEEPKEVKKIDKIILNYEMNIIYDRFKSKNLMLKIKSYLFNREIKFLSPNKSEKLFLNTFKDLYI